MTKFSGLHEDFSARKVVAGSSDRNFGLVFAVVLTVLAGFPLLRDGNVNFWLLGPAACFAAAAWIRPALLRPLNRAWHKFGLALNAVVNPVVLAIIFVTAIVPIGLLMRLTGKDPMNRRWDGAAQSYWTERQPPGPAPETMKDQF